MFKWLMCSCFLLNILLTVYAAPAKLSIHLQHFRDTKRANKHFESVSTEFKTYYYPQTLDHFNYNPQSYQTFKQRYVINAKYWGGAASNAPIFAYLGEESPLDDDLPIVGFLPDNAPSFKALMIYIEHRFYGESSPFGLRMEDVMKNESVRGYFSSAQAIADYAEVLLFTKKRLSALNSPIIVVGGSYGGMLASWFRLKYPHIAIGALASSAPILYFDNITPQNGYYSIVSKDFKECSLSCYKIIKKSWSEIDKVGAKSNGLSVLSKKFNTCSMLNDSAELKNYLDTLYCAAAQYDKPPTYPVTQVCGGINGAPKGSDILDRIYAGLVAFRGNRSCYNVTEGKVPSESNIGWSWQTCSEMVMPIGIDSHDTMFPESPFDLKGFTESCKSMYGVSPRPHWIRTFYGGHDIKLVLQRFASNIIFSNGLRDPYSSGGVLENISNTVHSIFTKNGSHALDLHPASADDPEWLVMQRKREIEIIQGWLNQYYLDLYAINGY